MTLYKSIFPIFCLGLASLALVSCGSSKDDPSPNPSTPSKDGVKAGLTTEVITRAEHLNEIPVGGKMNLFLYKNPTTNSEQWSTNTFATLEAGGWEITPELYLKGDQKAYVLAAYPYAADVHGPKVYPIDITAQQDVLYSGSFKQIDVNNPKCVLKMNHALSMVCFEFDTSKYNGQGNITSIGFEGEVVATTLTMDIQTGTLTDVTNGGFNVNVNSNVKSTGKSSPSVWVAPFSTKQKSAQIKMTIDGKNYVANMPEINMLQGYRYGLHLILTDNGMVVRADLIDTISLNDVLAAAEQAQGYGMVRFQLASNATSFTFPLFSGIDVFGNVSTNDVQANYSVAGSLNLGSSKLVTVETWNSTGFEVSNIEGIEEIDLSSY